MDKNLPSERHNVRRGFLSNHWMTEILIHLYSPYIHKTMYSSIQLKTAQYTKRPGFCNAAIEHESRFASQDDKTSASANANTPIVLTANIAEQAQGSAQLSQSNGLQTNAMNMRQQVARKTTVPIAHPTCIVAQRERTFGLLVFSRCPRQTGGKQSLAKTLAITPKPKYKTTSKLRQWYNIRLPVFILLRQLWCVFSSIFALSALYLRPVRYILRRVCGNWLQGRFIADSVFLVSVLSFLLFLTSCMRVRARVQLIPLHIVSWQII